MAYTDQQMSGNRVVAIIIVAIIHIAIGYALVTGLAYKAATQVIERVTTVDIDEPPPPEPEDGPDDPDDPRRRSGVRARHMTGDRKKGDEG